MSPQKNLSEVENLLNEQLRIEEFASYFYRSCYSYVSSRKIALPNVAKFFDKQANEELEHAKGIIDFMYAKGYNIVYKPIEIPDTDYKSVLEVFEKSFEYEVLSSNHINKINTYANENNDHMLCQFLEEYVEEQRRSEFEFDSYLTWAKRCDSSLGLELLDQKFKGLLEEKK